MTDITLLDGSIGQELVKRSGDRATPLWSTRVMMDRPDLVATVHQNYFDAGATIASTNTYAVHRSRLVRVGLEDEVLSLLEVALDQAERARDAHGSGRIAGVLGPLLASYRPDLKPDPNDAEQKFGELTQAMVPRVDLFLIESVSSVLEAEGVLRATQGCGKPVWLAMTVDDDDGTRLRSGERLAGMVPLLDRFDPDAVLLNCSRPEAVTKGLEKLAGFGRPFGGYANGFARISEGFLTDAPTVDALEQRVDLGPEAYADHAMHWVAQGATIVGGCCEVGPDHIAELARRLRAAGHSIV
ncbi:homocysteine S-methyltransferase family protein [Sedimentitalea todarodis]|uniref:Homocysteine S-methyltransferase family protein n=1 Tax=Sedimentitalea todarodis TaxID=1631240 RepID=A0ABU3VA07_9RHOB|nr:homocysteine S-methyltransferase family protein [Sedimentitalea todarodis]MDU9003005.1 homocysteine S-methyltransferase family protein [Sedimentitalea todarodis]